jgi:hypothetical protein
MELIHEGLLMHE